MGFEKLDFGNDENPNALARRPEADQLARRARPVRRSRRIAAHPFGRGARK
jgi:hypothetical protein